MRKEIMGQLAFQLDRVLAGNSRFNKLDREILLSFHTWLKEQEDMSVLRLMRLKEDIEKELFTEFGYDLEIKEKLDIIDLSSMYWMHDSEEVLYMYDEPLSSEIIDNGEFFSLNILPNGCHDNETHKGFVVQNDHPYDPTFDIFDKAKEYVWATDDNGNDIPVLVNHQQ